ncbi:MAG TPA: hypothetical protein VIT41_03825 [Microlunatus sp.]
MTDLDQGEHSRSGAVLAGLPIGGSAVTSLKGSTARGLYGFVVAP